MELKKFFKQIFNIKDNIQVSRLSFKTFLTEHLKTPLLLDNKLSGVIIEKFLSPSEVSQIVNNIISHHKLTSQAKGYFVFPPTCFHPDLLSNLKENYFNNVQSWEKEIGHISSFNLKNRIITIFEKLVNKKSVLPLYGTSKEENFLFGNFRIMYEETGKNATAHIHTGHALTKRSKNYAYKHLMDDIDFDNQWSYFILLQNSEIGGEITLYDYNYDKYPNVSQDEVFYDKKNGSFTPKADEIHSYKLNPGDMIIFKGGNIYHRVELVKGISPRITFGGFITTDLKKENVYYWI